MTVRFKLLSIICLLVVPQIGLGQDGVAASKSIPSFPLPSATTTKLSQTLDEPTTVDWNQTPLETALDSLEKKHHIEIWMNKLALQKAGISTNLPIQLQLKEVSLRSCLRLMLEPLDLTYVIDDEVMMITSAVAASERSVTRIYPVGDLSPKSDEIKQLMDLLKCGLGFPAELQGIPPLAISGKMKTLTARGPSLMQENVAELLQAIRDAQAPDAHTTLSSLHLTPTETRIKQTLDEQTSVNWSDIKLLDAMKDLEQQHNINIWFDNHALAELGVDTDQQVTLNLRKTSLQSCLRLLLEPLGLAYSIERDVLMVTSQEALDAKVVTRVYPVGDFCATNEDAMQLLNTFECGLGKRRYTERTFQMVVSFGLKAMVVRDTTVVQHKVQELIMALRDAQATNPKVPENPLTPN